MIALRCGQLGFMFFALCGLACGGGGEGLSPDHGGGRTDAGDIAPPCGPTTLATGVFTLSFGGADYGYGVHMPPGYDAAKRTPLVLNWHGYTSNAAQQEAFSGFNTVGDEEGFIVVYPNSPDASWNGGTCCSSTRDDVGFARALVADISSKACIDAKRVYSTGMSNGGFMSFRLGCEAADLFAAVAPVAGKIGVAGCRPSRPIPLLAIHGTSDTLVPYGTGGLSADMLTVPDTAKKWAELDGCTKGPDKVLEEGNARCEAWSGCGGDATVTLCTVEGGGHCWPGQSFCPFTNVPSGLDANRQIAEFFKTFRLP